MSGRVAGTGCFAGGYPRPMGANGPARQARFCIGDVVRHRLFPFRGVIYDVDPTFSHTEE